MNILRIRGELMETEGFVEFGYISHEFTIWCGKCKEWDQISRRNKTSVEKYFRMTGWEKTKLKGWVCPKCQTTK